MDEQNQIPIPNGLTFEIWVKQFILNFPNQIIPYPPPVKYWWGWAENLKLNPFFDAAPVPDRKQYKEEKSWELWAVMFILSMQSSV